MRLKVSLDKPSAGIFFRVGMASGKCHSLLSLNQRSEPTDKARCFYDANLVGWLPVQTQLYLLPFPPFPLSRSGRRHCCSRLTVQYGGAAVVGRISGRRWHYLDGWHHRHYDTQSPCHRTDRRAGGNLSAPQARTSLASLEQVMAKPKDCSSNQVYVQLPAGGSEVFRCHDLSFRYKKEPPPVVDGLELSVRPGERIAILGKMGSSSRPSCASWPGSISQPGDVL